MVGNVIGDIRVEGGEMAKRWRAIRPSYKLLHARSVETRVGGVNMRYSRVSAIVLTMTNAPSVRCVILSIIYHYFMARRSVPVILCWTPLRRSRQ